MNFIGVDSVTNTAAKKVKSQMIGSKETTKEGLREKFRQRRRAFRLKSSAELEKAHHSMANQLRALLPDPPALMLTYVSCQSEAEFSGIYAMASGIRWAYPRVEGQTLQFYIPRALDEMEPNQWNIPEPRVEFSEKVSLNAAVGVFVPGVAFDRFGQRLGSGMAFYDRCLAPFTGLKIGVAYSTQISEEPLPSEAHDVIMDYVVTEEFTLKISKEKQRI